MRKDGTNEPIHTVAEAIQRVNRVLDEEFMPIWVTGEVANLYSTYHWYFNLIEGHASISCAMFNSVARRQRVNVEVGSKVNVLGKFSIYPERGQFQIIVQRIELAGEGAMRAAFEKLRRDLEREGLFRTEHKKPLPDFPTRVALITASGSAAIRDVVYNFNRRYPLTDIVHIPTLVQGRHAPDDIVHAIQRAMQPEVAADVVLLTRGGGSYEDLNAFNDEMVARAIFACPIPLVSAIGHERDVTMADYVADVRAATPSTAVELTTPDIEELRGYVHGFRQRAVDLVQTELTHRQQELDVLRARLNKPSQEIEHKEATLQRVREKLQAALKVQFERAVATQDALVFRLQRGSPQTRIDALNERLISIERRLQLANPITHLRDLERRRVESLRRLHAFITTTQTQRETYVAAVQTRLTQQNPITTIQSKTDQIARLRHTLTRSIEHAMAERASAHQRSTATLRAVSPFATLERGYAVVTKPDGTTWGQIVSNVEEVEDGDTINAHVHGGTIDAVVRSVIQRQDSTSDRDATEPTSS